MASSVDGVLASIDQVQSLSPDDFTRVIEHWKRHAAKLWAGPLQQLPMQGPAPPPQTSGIGVGVSVIQVSFFMQQIVIVLDFVCPQGKEREEKQSSGNDNAGTEADGFCYFHVD